MAKRHGITQYKLTQKVIFSNRVYSLVVDVLNSYYSALTQFTNWILYKFSFHPIKNGLFMHIPHIKGEIDCHGAERMLLKLFR